MNEIEFKYNLHKFLEGAIVCNDGISENCMLNDKVSGVRKLVNRLNGEAR
jgi:hypothetical protein